MLYGNDIRIYEFSFYFENEIGNTKYDERIAATIKSLLHSFFNDDPLIHNVLYYVCDYSDERQESRKLLFNRWFRNYSDVLVKDDLEIEIPDDTTRYGCLLRKNDFPFEYILKSEVIDKSEALFINKYEL